MTKSGRFRENFWADTTIVWTRGTMGPRRPGTSARDKPGGSPSSGLAARSESSTQTQLLFCETVDTPATTEDTTANLKQKTVTMALKVMRCEERNIFFGDLIRAGLGTREVENFISNQEYLRRRRGLGDWGRVIRKLYLREKGKCWESNDMAWTNPN